MRIRIEVNYIDALMPSQATFIFIRKGTTPEEPFKLGNWIIWAIIAKTSADAPAKVERNDMDRRKPDSERRKYGKSGRTVALFRR
jgi:hypothetical protein